jgi:hypothetical protein
MKIRTFVIFVVFILLALSWGFITLTLMPPGILYMVVAGAGGAILGLAMLLVLNRIRNKLDRQD